MARGVAVLWWGMASFFSLVLIAVSALWIHALRRAPRHYEQEQARRISRRWLIGGGLLLPGVTILTLLIFGTPVGLRMLPLPVGGPPPLRIEVIGHQWWWEVRYPDQGVVTANQLVIPAGQPVDLLLGSRDVIHSFWVPRLAGKLDMLPGRTNRMRVKADQPGAYPGQCSEFCGSGHAHMQLDLRAVPADEFEAWIGARQDPQVEPPPSAVGEVFGDYCGQCHRVAGVSEGGLGPDLSDVGSRPRLGAGTLVNEPGALARWLREHRELKPGNAMPSHAHLPDEQLEAIALWLEGLAP